MDEFERELREQLQARSAPGGFADRVMARVPERQASRRLWWALSPVWRWAAAALLVAGMVAGGLERDRQQRIAGERARAQVLLALRITGSTLRDVQQKIRADGRQENSRRDAGRTDGERDVR
jgi:hypothetical protein